MKGFLKEKIVINTIFPLHRPFYFVETRYIQNSGTEKREKKNPIIFTSFGVINDLRLKRAKAIISVMESYQLRLK